MVHEIDLINAGLTLIGTEAITSLDDGTDRAEVSRLYWNNSVDAFYEAHPWSFAQRETRLQKIAEAGLDIFGKEILDPSRDSSWEFAYALPEDFLRLVRFVGPACDRTFQLRGLGVQQALFCNMDDVSVIYLRKASYLPACAREAIYIRFAMFVDSARNGGANIQNLQRMYASAYAQTQSLDTTTHDRKRLDWGRLNRVRHDESADYRFANELRERDRESGYME